MKHSPFFLAIAAALLAFAPVACKKKAGEPDVYVLGTKGTGELVDEGGEITQPALWKNGVEVPLGLDSNAAAQAVFVSGNDVYLAGYVRVPTEDDEVKCPPMLWKNGVAKPLGDTGNAAVIFVSGGDVYVAGSVTDEKGTNMLTLWKNGVAQRLGGPGWIESIFVSGNDVYLVGQSFGKGNDPYVATLWKNGVAQRLGDGKDNSHACSVYVSGNDVYVAGDEAVKVKDERKIMATLWVNGEAKRLSDGTKAAQALHVSVSGKDVYVAGSEPNAEGNAVPTLWKNGAVQRYDGVPSPTSQSIGVYGGDVYWVGTTFDETSEEPNGTAMLWKNGKAQPLGDGKAHTWAYSVFVVGGGGREAARL